MARCASRAHGVWARISALAAPDEATCASPLPAPSSGLGASPQHDLRGRKVGLPVSAQLLDTEHGARARTRSHGAILEVGLARLHPSDEHRVVHARNGRVSDLHDVDGDAAVELVRRYRPLHGCERASVFTRKIGCRERAGRVRLDD